MMIGYIFSVSARAQHCGNPALQSEMAPRKTKQGPIWPFSFTRLCRLNTGINYILKAIPGLEIVIDTVVNVTSISSLATKTSGLVAIIRHNGDCIFLC